LESDVGMSFHGFNLNSLSAYCLLQKIAATSCTLQTDCDCNARSMHNYWVHILLACSANRIFCLELEERAEKLYSHENLWMQLDSLLMLVPQCPAFTIRRCISHSYLVDYCEQFTVIDEWCVHVAYIPTGAIRIACYQKWKELKGHNLPPSPWRN